MTDLSYPFNLIAESTIAVMTVAPQRKHGWYTHLQQGRTQAHINGDALMVALLDAILKLLLSNNLEEIKPVLTGNYADCWLSILDGITNAKQIDPAEQAILDLVNARSFDEQKQIIVARREQLLTDHADEIIGIMLEQYKNNADAARILEQHRRVLRRCRKEDVESVFADLPNPSDELQRIIAELNQLSQNARNVLPRIDLSRRALELVERRSHQELWASLHNDLGNSLAESPSGNRAENLEQSIYHSLQALEVFTQLAFPAQWASTQYNLGFAYQARIQGERADNIEQAIKHYELALKVYTHEGFPVQWAMAHINLASAYFERIQGERADNIEQVIDHYKLALKVYTCEEFPEKWAAIQISLALVYSARTRGKRADNVEQIIKYYKQALEIYTRESFPEKWADIQHILAFTYSARTRGKRANNIEIAINHYSQALEIHTRTAIPDKWALGQKSLGDAYRSRIQGERTDNIEYAIHCYQQALEVYTRPDFPAQWADTQNALGHAYTYRIQGNRADNMERAIHHHQQALEVYTRSDFPEKWAGAQASLGDALKRLQGDRADNMERAIHCYQQALEVYTRPDFPEKWAGAQASLGQAYSERLRGDRADNIERAIHCQQQALEIYTRSDFPALWAVVQNILGTAYYERIQGERTDNIEQAIKHYKLALEGFTRSGFPEQWAATQNALGAAYLQRIQGERADNIEQAIKHYKLALEVYTHKGFPVEWAITQNALGTTYSRRIRGERADNIKQAFYHFTQALEVQTLEMQPSGYRQAQRNIGDLRFQADDLEAALIAYTAAIDAGDLLLSLSHTEAGRQAEVFETSSLYTRMAYCLLFKEQPGEALMMLERAKTRLLTEVLVLSDVDLNVLSLVQQAQIRASRQVIRNLEAEMRRSPETLASQDYMELSDLLHKSRVELKTLIDVVRKDYPNFIPKSLDLAQILAAIPQDSALVAPFVTPYGGALFIVPGGTTEVTFRNVTFLTNFTDNFINTFLTGSPESPGWRRWNFALTRTGTSDDHRAWQIIVEMFGKDLWSLMKIVYEQLKKLGVKRVILMPSGGLQLLPLHAAWREIEGKKRYFIDDFEEVSYVPSVQVLDISKHRAASRNGTSALVAGIGSYQKLPPLLNSCSEAEAIAKVLGVQPLLNQSASLEVIERDVPGKSYVHLSCHGTYAWFGNVFDSGLFLARDELLTLSQIVAGKLDLTKARLVTLSACETGIIDVSQSPDEFLGLPAALLEAGTPGVVSSLWVVEERSTALLMERFYRNHIEQEQSPAAALRNAQIWLRDLTRKELADFYRKRGERALSREILLGGHPEECLYEHAYFWAAFTVNGF